MQAPINNKYTEQLYTMSREEDIPNEPLSFSARQTIALSLSCFIIGVAMMMFIMSKTRNISRDILIKNGLGYYEVNKTNGIKYFVISNGTNFVRERVK